MRVFTTRFLLGGLAIATVCVIASPAEAGPLRRLFGGRGAAASTAACSPDAGYGYGAGYGQAAAYPATAYGYAATPCCDAAPMAYGSAGYGSMAYARRGFRSASNYQQGQAYGSASYYQPGQTYGSGSYYQPGQVYGAGGYHQPGHLIPAGGVPMPLPGIGSSGTTDTTPANAEKAKITDSAFEPATITIKPGTAVRWINDGQKPHTVTSVKGDWDSGELQPGREFTATFTKPGTFEYHCKFHKEMKGTIIVK